MMRFFSAVGMFFGKAPQWVYYLIGAITILATLAIIHGHWVKAHDKKLTDKLYTDINRQAARLTQEAVKLRSEATSLQNSANKKVEGDYDKETNSIHANANALRLRLPPQCPAPSGLRGLSSLPGTSGGVETSSSGPTDAGLAAIPWLPLIDYGEEYDRRGAQINATLDWYDSQRKIYDDALAKLDKLGAKTP